MYCVNCAEDINLGSQPYISTKNGIVCKNCRSKDIDVFFIALVGNPDHGFYTASLNLLEEELVSMSEEESDDDYLVRRKLMNVVEYNDLPEFEGF